MIPKLTGRAIAKRAKELAPIREKALQTFKQNPSITSRELGNQFGIARDTACGWLHRWRRKPPKTPPRKPAISITWEQIIKAIPDTTTLGTILLDGFMSRIKERDDIIIELKKQEGVVNELRKQLKAIVEDRKAIMQQLNEHLVKEKVGSHFTLDKVQHTLIPNQEYRR